MKTHRVRVFIFLFGIFIVGCGQEQEASQTTSIEDLEQFYTDSEFIYEMLMSIHDEGRTELTYEEEREIIAYEAYYGPDSDFYNKAKNPDIKLISTGILLMKSYLLSTSTTVGGIDYESEFSKQRSEVKKLLNENHN